MQLVERCWAEPDLYIMADEFLVDEAEGAVFRICPMEKAPDPVLIPDQAWEGGDGKKQLGLAQDAMAGDVLWDAGEKRFHCWYRSHNRLVRSVGTHTQGRAAPQGSRVCYATSPDGLHWEKPVVGQVLWDGSFENNMVEVAKGPVLSNHLSGVTLNRVSGIDAALVGTLFSKFDDPVYTQGITQLFSADGLDWRVHFPPTLPIDGDAHCLMWDYHNECYLCTTRSAAFSHSCGLFRGKGYDDIRNRRHVAIARSRDLVHWTPMMTVLEADEQDAREGFDPQLYYMYILPYGHGYVGFVQLFYIDVVRFWTYGPLEMQLTFARDWIRWHRVGDREPILPRGPEGAWDQEHVSLGTSPPHPEGNRMRYWYGGKDTGHWQSGNAGMGTATLRQDGFACWEAGEDGGTVLTAPLNMSWATWPFVNVEAPKGEVRVEILDAETRKPIEGCAKEDCDPITGDHLRAQVQYGERRGNFVRHTGKIRLKFHLRNAKLYAFKAPNTSLGEGSDAGVPLWK